jgi:hypothetical protein
VLGTLRNTLQMNESSQSGGMNPGSGVHPAQPAPPAANDDFQIERF